MKRTQLAVLMIITAMYVFISPTSRSSAAEFHVTNGNELWSVLLDEVPSNGEDDVVYLAAGTYSHNFPHRPPSGCFTTSAGGDSLTIMGEPGTTASDVVIDAHGRCYCLQILDRSLHPSYTDLPYETVSDPEFDRPEIVVSGITFQNGESTYDTAGLYIAADYYSVVVKDSIIRNNSSGSGHGGGLHVSGAFNLLLENNQILNNTVRERLVHTGSHDHPVEEINSRGGGVHVWNAWNGVTVINNIVAANVAEGNSSEGGGMYICHSCGTTAQLINNTIYGNIASEGGGVHFSDIPSLGGTINLYNNIIYANTATGSEGSADLYFWEDPAIGEGWRVKVYAYNNNFSHVLGTMTESAQNLNTDPRFVNSAAGNFHLAHGSPMINAGRNIVPDPPGLPATDFEGDGRVNGGIPDIGADEYYPGRGGVPRRRMPAGLDIRSHGKEGPFIKKPFARASLTISLAANDDKGKKSTLWIVMNSPMGTYFLSGKGWTKEKAVYYKGPLRDILPVDLPRPPRFVKEGDYQFYFILDMPGPPFRRIKTGKKTTSKITLSDSIVFHVTGKDGKRQFHKPPLNRK